MLSTQNWGQSATLYQSLPVGVSEIALAPADRPRFAVPAGQWYYLTVRYNQRREVVQVQGLVDGKLQVTRAQDGTSEQSWPAGACVEVEWNPQQLREFLWQVGAGTEPTGVNPGTYCLDCTSCLTVNAAGQITRVDGAGGCA